VGFITAITIQVVIPNTVSIVYWFAVVYRTVRVWIKRNTGQYWPSICHTMPGIASWYR